MGKKKDHSEEDVDDGEVNDNEEDQSYSGKKSKKKVVKKKQQPAEKAKRPKQDKPEKQPQSASKKKQKPKEKQQQPKAKPRTDKEDKKKDYLPGQKYPTPEQQDGAMAFYKSLYEKNPKSEMARKYCLQYGTLELQEASKLLKEITKAKK